MTNLRHRWHSDPEHLTSAGAARDNSGDGRSGGRTGGGGLGRGGGRAAGGALGRGGGRAVGGTLGRGGGRFDAFATHDSLLAGQDTHLDMDKIEEEDEHKGNRKNKATNNTAKSSWMRTEDNRWMLLLSYLVEGYAIYSSIMAPLECAFKVKGLSKYWLFLILGEVLFLSDIARQWIYVFRDNHDMGLLSILRIIMRNPRKLLETLGLIPWYYTVQWKYLVLLKIVRALRGKEVFERFEKLSEYYSFIRFLKLLAIQLYCIHTTGCMLYLLAATSDVNQTWMSPIQIGDKNLTQLGFVENYVTSIYFATVTLSTVGYGDIHAVNVKEMVVVAGFIISSVIVWTYVGVNLTNLFVRKSRTQIVREKMDIMEKQLRNTNVNDELAKQIRDHMVIKYEEEYDNKFLEDVPTSIRTKITRDFNESIIKSVSLFCGCSPEFMKYLASEVREDFYAPGYTLLEEGSIVTQLYILFSGNLEQVRGGVVHEHILPTRILGLESLVLNVALPSTFRARKKSKILRLRKQYFVEALETYVQDAATVIGNLTRGTDPAFVESLKDSEFGLRMQKNEIKNASLLNHAVYDGNFSKVKALVASGVDVNSMDYSDISPLHVAATRGNTEIATFLIDNGADINTTDLNGTTPLLKAIKNGHDGVAAVLAKSGALLGIGDDGEYLCKVVSENDLALLKRLLEKGMDPNARNVSGQTPLHIAAATGRDALALELLSAKADGSLEDSWGHLPIDEANKRKQWSMSQMLSKKEAEHDDQAS